MTKVVDGTALAELIGSETRAVTTAAGATSASARRDLDASTRILGVRVETWRKGGRRDPRPLRLLWGVPKTNKSCPNRVFRREEAPRRVSGMATPATEIEVGGT